jgi:hypothetical protein
MRLSENKISLRHLKHDMKGFKNPFAGFTSFFLVHRRRLKPQSVLVYYFFEIEKIGPFAKTGLISGGLKAVET